MINEPEVAFDSGRLFAAPEWYPYHVEGGARTLEFRYMTADDYRASPFLDHRIVTHPDVPHHVLHFTQLPARDALPAPQATWFIFHNAFCCSTLLTRYLDALHYTLVLREPHSLYELATLKRFKGTGLMPELDSGEWQWLYDLLTVLLARRYRDGPPVIVKPSDGCNNLMTNLLQANVGNKGVFIYSTLERFLASVLKLPQRHEWARIRVRELSLDKRQRGVPVLDPRPLNHWQCATLVWVYHMQSYRDTLAAVGQERLCAIDSQALLAGPEQTLDAVMNFYKGDEASSLERPAQPFEVSGSHSKDPQQSYDPAQRERDFAEVRQQRRQEIDAGLAWGRELLGESDTATFIS